jgi:HTH-type transcriptional regulator, sugar sensing transcriptional regulator
MNIENALIELGLTKNEAKVYLALHELGLTTTTNLIKKTALNTSKVYESLERLLKKGLVSYSLIHNKKHWQSENSKEQLLAFLDEEKKNIQKKEELINIISPQINELKKLNNLPVQNKIFEGTKGIKQAREDALELLKKGDTFYLILSSYPDDKKLNAYWEDFQKRRAAKGIKYKAIFNNSLQKIAEQRKKLPNSEVKFINPNFLSPTWMEIYSDYVGIGVMGQTPSMFIIKNPEVSKGFIEYFEQLWTIAKK